MAYEKTTWKDRVVEKPNTFTMQQNADGSITLIPKPGQVIEPGTIMNASNMNKIEDELINVNSSLEHNVNYRQDISVSVGEFSYLSTDIEKLQATHDFIVSMGGGTMVIPSGIYSITDTFNWDISIVSIQANNSKIIANINDLNKYAIKLKGSKSSGYGSPLTNKLKRSYGFELVGNYTCNGIDVSGTSQTVNNAHITIENIMVHKFDKGINFGANSYMINFNNCCISFNRINIHTTVENNMGERISFTGCDITGTQGIANSYCIYNPMFVAFHFSNCSFDWHKRLFYNVGALFFENCHIETPSYAMPTINDSFYYGECGDKGYVYINGGRVLLNNGTENNILALFNLTNDSARLTINNTHWEAYFCEYVATGNGKVNFNVKLFNNSTNVNHMVCNNKRSKMLLDGAFQNSTITDTWTINHDIPLVVENNSLKVTQKSAGSSTIVTLSIPIKKIESFYKLVYSYYFTSDKKPSDVTVKFLDINKNLVKQMQKSTPTTTSLNAWVKSEIPLRFIQTDINLDLVYFVSIEFRSYGLANNETWFIKDVDFQCY